MRRKNCRQSRLPVEGTAFSKDVDTNLSYRPPNGKKLFLSISPLNKDRSDLAPYAGMQTSDKRPKPGLTVWDAYLNARFARDE